MYSSFSESKFRTFPQPLAYTSAGNVCFSLRETTVSLFLANISCITVSISVNHSFTLLSHAIYKLPYSPMDCCPLSPQHVIGIIQEGFHRPAIFVYTIRLGKVMC